MKPHRKKILSQKKLVAALSRARGKIVFTNGVFDLIHPGHVDYLEHARALGDVLVVAVNEDASVRTLGKGPRRPVNPTAARMQVVAGLASVDYVTSFSESTPLNLIKKIMPDVLVKGGDWKASQIVGAKEVLASGGRVKSLKFLKGHSTTAILSKFRS